MRSGAHALQDMEAIYQRFPHLKERRKQLAATLSGGERQMLALGRALMAKPLLLMLDEPSLGLAPTIVRQIFHVIADLRSAGVAILLVEQNARAALQIADYGYVLEMGELVLQGGAAELAARPRVVETYLGLTAGARWAVASDRNGQWCRLTAIRRACRPRPRWLAFPSDQRGRRR